MEKLIDPNDLINLELNEVVSKVEEVKETKSSKKASIPRNEVDLVSLAKRVATYWSGSSHKLSWITAEEFSNNITAFEQALNTQTTTKAGRSPMAAQISILNKEINKNIEHIKYYLIEKYGKRVATSYYAKFGIVKNSNTYKLPIDQEYKVKALQELLKGLESEGLEDRVYGKTYWTEVYNSYNSLVANTSTNISQVSAQIMTKYKHKINIKKVLSSLLFLIRANNPDTYDDESRVWGFQKKKY